MRINITGCLLALLCAPAYCLGQTDPDTWIRSAEVQAVIRQLSEKYGITGVTRPYQDTGQRVISDIEPILKWLDTTYGARNWTVSASAREFYKSFRVDIRRFQEP